ncbi:fumarate reductase [Aeromonas simiae]|uniref:fumarate reductase n=1 Tax=Aeromonas simiae TaxID=218936 RepID=UPI0005A7D7DD|nr:fumarate reductase [Aeromonas simiae]MDO2949184.1 fumarate reductase subunit C [Aeromonas simiae]MDO2951166.1 fumarate reductase subunit C [Aeromonas simiae]MDO2956402.1 fumarate reductase subunit C [Aeromonas simiae]
MNNENSKRKPYVREMKKDWWLKNAFYTGYMIREGTSLFVSIYAVVLMWGLLRLVQGPDAFNAWLESLQNPLAILFHVIALAACLFHAKTWFALAPKAMRIFKGDQLIPEKPIVLVQYVALAVVSALVLIIVA